MAITVVPVDGDALEERDDETRPAATTADPIAGKNFGRFERVEFVGQGGMARVYRAYDPQLSRIVALKLIRGSDPELTERLVMEARAQARVDHENVCRIYEAGDVEGRRYIAMQYIEGRPLSEFVDGISLEQKLHLLKEIAEGVHAAHRVGLIHRDLKPSNILVERSEDGQLIPHVMDFGLAREAEAPGVTATGVIVGSPWYMSPEQAKGMVRQLDRRTDIYSLGVTAYELITGNLPFDGNTTLEVILKMLEHEPPAMRIAHTTVPRDVEIIVRKCLEKDPGRRYESARALAEDVQRYLDGEPIRAIPSGWIIRRISRIKRHPVASSLLGGALLVILALAAMYVSARVSAQKRAAMAQRFGLEVKEVESVLRFASLLPPHDIRPDVALVRRKIQSIRGNIESAGTFYRGPGLYAIGRGHLALHEYSAARTALDQAWNEGYRAPDVAYALGAAYAGLYQKEVQETDRIRNKEYREIRAARVERQFGVPALQYLSAGTGASLDPPEYIEARVAYIQKKYDEALERARAAAAGIGWFYEADVLAGDILARLANRKRDQGEIEQAYDLYAQAEQSYRTAMSKGSSDPVPYEALCGLHSDVMQMRTYLSGTWAQKDFDSAIEVCGEALKINPDSADAYARISRVYYRLAEYRSDHGEDPIEAISRSIESAGRATELNPKSAEAFNTRGNAYTLLGEHLRYSGKDPRNALRNAITSLSRAIQIRPELVPPHTNLGLTYSRLAEYEISKGLDPSESLKRAARSAQDAVDISPELSYSYNNLAIALHDQGEYMMAHGGDPTEIFGRAVQACNRGIRLNPKFSYAYVNRGNSELRLGQYLQMLGRNGRKPVEAALESFREAIEISPDDVYGYENSTKACEILAILQLESGEDPSAAIASGREFLRRTTRIEPDDPALPGLEAQLDLVMARWSLSRNESPLAFLDHAQQRAEEGARLDPESARSWIIRAQVDRWRATGLLSDGKDAAAAIRSGIAAADSAVSANPRDAEAHALRGVLWLLKADSDHGERPVALQNAAESLQKALAINANLSREYEPFLKQASASR